MQIILAVLAEGVGKIQQADIQKMSDNKKCHFLVTKDFYLKYKVIYATNDTLIGINVNIQQEFYL